MSCLDTEAQLENRNRNAPLLRYVDSLRTHGHRAARIDPLDLLRREEVAALDPTRYGLVDETKEYNINGILWTKPLSSEPQYLDSRTIQLASESNSDEWWTLGDITRHLRSVYTGSIAYEYMHSHSKTERLFFSHLLESQSIPSAAEPTENERKQKKQIHKLLARSEVLDGFLQLKFRTSSVELILSDT